MPKKFKGENSKAASAKERKAAAKEAADREKRQKEEDEYWRDDSKQVTRKQERKVLTAKPTPPVQCSVSARSSPTQDDRERKRQEQLERKQEAKLVLEEEEAKIGGKTKSAPKVTRTQISMAEEQRRKESEGASALPRGVVVEQSLEKNPNHLLREKMERGELEARTVEEAIDVLSVSQDQGGDKHPEKRQKAAYAAFEEREMPRLMAENPNLRQSQIKQLLRKEWLKSPENPINHM